MSGRGSSRGGRGRGRFGRGASATQQLIRDNLQELGIDSKQYYQNSSTAKQVVGTAAGIVASATGTGEEVADGRGPPPLHPQIELPAPPEITVIDSINIQSKKNLCKKLQSSPFYLTTEVEQRDIERYSDMRKRSQQKISPLEFIMGELSTEEMHMYLPPELFSRSKRQSDGGASRGSRKRSASIDLQHLEKAEMGKRQSSADSQAQQGQGVQEKDDLSDEEEDPLERGGVEVEDDIDGDYIVDHYASDDNDGDIDGDGEAVF